jgi:hypothetical protein
MSFAAGGLHSTRVAKSTLLCTFLQQFVLHALALNNATPVHKVKV